MTLLICCSDPAITLQVTKGPVEGSWKTSGNLPLFHSANGNYRFRSRENTPLAHLMFREASATEKELLANKDLAMDLSSRLQHDPIPMDTLLAIKELLP